MNLFTVRLRSGTDLIVILLVDRVSHRVECVASSAFAGATPGEERGIAATLKIIQATPLEKWVALHQQTKSQQDPVPCDRASLEKEFGSGHNTDNLPHSGAVGWLLDDDRRYPKVFYFGCWMAGGYDVRYQLNGVVEQLDAAFRSYNAAGHPIADNNSEIFSRLADGDRKIIIDEAVKGANGGHVDELTTAGEHYPLRSRLHWVFDPIAERLHVEGLSPSYVGEGPTRDKAWAAFLSQFHNDFQALHRTRPFNRDEQQDRIWRHLYRFVDVASYRDRKPRRLWRTGKVARVCKGKYVVAWVYERAAEWVPLDRAPENFRHFKVGTWFEAQVEYNARTRELLRMVSARADDSLLVEDEEVHQPTEDQPD